MSVFLFLVIVEDGLFYLTSRLIQGRGGSLIIDMGIFVLENVISVQKEEGFFGYFGDMGGGGNMD